MSLQADVITELYNTIVNDSTVQGIIGNPARMYNTRAVKNPVFPYCVHRLENDAVSPVVISAQYILDLYDYETTEAQLLNLRDRIITLLDKNKFSINSSRAIRTNYFNDMQVAEEGENYLHRVLIFTVRYGRFEEIENVIDRG